MWFGNSRFILALIGMATGWQCALAVVEDPSDTPFYCSPDQTDCWPKARQWERLEHRLTGELHLYSTLNNGQNARSYQECLDAGTDSTLIRNSGEGICMMYHDCRYDFCAADKSDDPEALNLPAAAVEAVTKRDLRLALRFARRHRMSVTVKTSGHNYSGSSTAKNSLLILTKSLDTNGIEVLHNYRRCRTRYDDVVEIGGGNIWADVYDVVGDDYNIVGGFGSTVSAIGGWLQGGGLSPLVRKYGLGIDQVIDFDVMLPSGRRAKASACQNPDLFYALRGGGGGTYGIVLQARYKLHPVEPVTELFFNIAVSNDLSNLEAVGRLIPSWLGFWFDQNAQGLPDGWGGYWSNTFSSLYFTGDPDAAQPFIDALDAWKSGLAVDDQVFVSYFTRTEASYVSARANSLFDPNVAGDLEFYTGSRYVAEADLQQDTAEVYGRYLSTLPSQPLAFNYMMGGATQEVSPDETAINPLAREAIWQLTFLYTTDPAAQAGLAALRAAFPNSGSGYNHGYKQEPNWEEAFWGAEKYEELRGLKKHFDPKNLLNCWHCVGYQGVHFDGKVTQDASRDSECFDVLCADTERCVDGSCVE